MKYLVSIITLLLFTITTVFAQDKLVLKLQGKPIDIEKKGIYKFVGHSQKKINHPDSAIISINSDTINRYNFNRYFFTKTRKPGLKNYLSILVGVDTKNIPVIIVDKNFNNNFSDDTVYRYPVLKSIVDENEFYNHLPEIKVDSIDIENNAGQIEKKTVALKLAPFVDGSQYLNSASNVKNTKTLNLAFYVMKYLSAGLKVDGNSYEIAILPHPFSFFIFNYHSIEQDGSRWFFSLFKNSSRGKDSLISRDIYQKVADNPDGDNNIFKTGNKYAVIHAISLDSNLITISLSGKLSEIKVNNVPADRNKKLQKYALYSLKEKRNTNYNFKNNKITLLEFSGSWCVPCQEILPKLKKLFSAYGDKIQMVTVLEEKSEDKAWQYYQKEKLPWKLFYENIDSAETLKTTMKVNVYPSFFLIDKAGEILFHSSTILGLKEIENKLNTF